MPAAQPNSQLSPAPPRIPSDLNTHCCSQTPVPQPSWLPQTPHICPILSTPSHVCSLGYTYDQPAPNHDHLAPCHQHGDIQSSQDHTQQSHSSSPLNTASHGPGCSHMSSVPSRLATPLSPNVTSTHPDSQAPILSGLTSPAGTKGTSVYSEPALLAPGRPQ